MTRGQDPDTQASGAFSALYTQQWGRVYRSVHRIVHDADDAADVTQEAFARAYARLDSIDAACLTAWLMTVARNAAIDHLRRTSRTVAEGIGDGDADVSTLPDHSIASDPAAMAEAAVLQHACWLVIRLLPPRHARLLALSLQHGVEADDLARAISVSRAHLHVRLNRARREFREVAETLLLLRGSACACPALRVLLGGCERTGLTRCLRRRVERHLTACAPVSARPLIVAPVSLDGIAALGWPTATQPPADSRGRAESIDERSAHAA